LSCLTLFTTDEAQGVLWLAADFLRTQEMITPRLDAEVQHKRQFVVIAYPTDHIKKNKISEKQKAIQ
jgi:hypothetical protein